jgi:hypothetical protein
VLVAVVIIDSRVVGGGVVSVKEEIASNDRDGQHDWDEDEDHG